MKEKYDPISKMFHWLVFLLVAIEFLVAAAMPEMRGETDVSIHTEPLANAMHYALYISLIAMPILGWAWASSRALAVSFFGLYSFSPLIIPGISAPQLGAMHSLLGVIIVLLVLVHVFAALYHHYVTHDETLIRMLPVRLAEKMKIEQK